MVVWPI